MKKSILLIVAGILSGRALLAGPNDVYLYNPNESYQLQTNEYKGKDKKSHYGNKVDHKKMEKIGSIESGKAFKRRVRSCQTQKAMLLYGPVKCGQTEVSTTQGGVFEIDVKIDIGKAIATDFAIGGTAGNIAARGTAGFKFNTKFTPYAEAVTKYPSIK